MGGGGEQQEGGGLCKGTAFTATTKILRHSCYSIAEYLPLSHSGQQARLCTRSGGARQR